MSLSQEQQDLVTLVLGGSSVFFTGAAGTGKSTVLRAIIAALPSAGLHVTALTGLAALPLGGGTLHKFAGIGLGLGTAEELLQGLGRQGRANLRGCRVLVVDEISMLSAQLFDKLEYLARTVRGNELAFGGIQLVMCGDFLQCPPVDRDAAAAFEADSWPRCAAHQVVLRELHRQREPELVELVNAVRHNNLTPAHRDLLNWLKRPLEHTDGIAATRLYCRNASVDRENTRELARLTGASTTYEAVDTGREPWKSELARNCVAPAQIELRVGAQVMLTKNSSTRANGQRGVVIALTAVSATVRFADGEQVVEPVTWSLQDHASRTQLPLKLAWCMTVHKSQGMTIDRLEVRIDDAFDYGIAYVALSRCSTLAGLRVSAWDEKKFKVNSKVRRYYRSLQA